MTHGHAQQPPDRVIVESATVSHRGKVGWLAIGHDRGTHILGKNAALVEHLAPSTLLFTDDQGRAIPPDQVGPDEARRAAAKRVDKTRGDIQKSLTPWIPGDFLLTYGTLLTAWDSIAASFEWLLLLGFGIPVIFVWLGAFSLNGFTDWPASLGKKLLARTIAGGALSVLVAATVPRSGWQDFAWFRAHEQSVLTTLGESPRVSWRLDYLEPAPVGAGV